MFFVYYRLLDSNRKLMFSQFFALIWLDNFISWLYYNVSEEKTLCALCHKANPQRVAALWGFFFSLIRVG